MLEKSIMETEEHNEHVVAFPLSIVHGDIPEHVISHEEICEPTDQCEVEEDLNEVIVMSNSNQNSPEDEIALKILGIHDNVQMQDEEMRGDTVEADEEEEDETSVIYPVYIKEENHQQFDSRDDESMAVEALRQLGGMYCFEDKRITCTTCSKSLLHSDLEKHRESCNAGKHKCNTCGEHFERKIDLNNHMVCHQVDRPHACRTCGNLFRSKSSLQSHMVEVHQVEKPHKCNVCGADFHRPSSLSNHMKIHSYVAGRALMQSMGGNSNANTIKIVGLDPDNSSDQVQWAVQTYNIHNNQMNEISMHPEKLETLQEFTVLPNGEIAQIEYTHDTQTGQDSPQFVTLGSINNAGTLIKVNDNSQGEDVETYIKINSQDDDNKGFTCGQCGVTFARAVSLSLHEKSHLSKNEWVSPVECEFCDKQFQDQSKMNAHQATCTKRLLQTTGEGDLPASKWNKHTCSECGKKFTTKQKMFRHQWIHRKKTHSCEVCGMQFEKQSELDEHRLKDHPGDSPFTCSECGKSFVSRQGLWEHSRTHAGSPAHFQCDTCSKTFSSRQGYLIHHRTHTGERPYGCKFCWKAFRDGGTLRKHERIHTGERPHVCPLCSRAFNQKVVLREHVRWVHAAGKNETQPTGPPYPCPLCGSMNQDRDELCAHIVKHSDQMIAEAKIKAPAAKVKTTRAKSKKSKVKTMTSNSIVDADISTEPNETIISLTEAMDSDTQDKYLLLKNDYNDAVCIKTVGKLSNYSQNENQNETVNLNTMQLIPITTSGDVIHLLPTKSNTTLQLISKQNKNSPVLTIPNNQTKGNILTKTNECKVSTGILLSACDKSKEKKKCENDIFVQSVPKTELKDDENDDGEEYEELICEICGHEFYNRNVLMEHVKIHI